VNVTSNLLSLAVCRHGDSVLYNLLNGVQLPISNLLYASPVIMTAALATSLDFTVWIGLVIVTAGFLIYQFMPLEGMPWWRCVGSEPRMDDKEDEPKDVLEQGDEADASARLYEEDRRPELVAQGNEHSS
jgi:hypothetical protein